MQDAGQADRGEVEGQMEEEGGSPLHAAGGKRAARDRIGHRNEKQPRLSGPNAHLPVRWLVAGAGKWAVGD